jgi:hypothetical protein
MEPVSMAGSTVVGEGFLSWLIMNNSYSTNSKQQLYSLWIMICVEHLIYCVGLA